MTNASVIGRVWPDQAAFQSEVLLRFALEEGSSQFVRTIGPLERLAAVADTRTVEKRRQLLQQLCRAGAAANMQAIRKSPTWNAWRGIWAYAFQRSGRSPKFAEERRVRRLIQRALLRQYEQTTDDYESLFKAVGPVLGFRLRDEFTYRQLTTSVTALAEGCGLRDQVDPGNSRDILRRTGPREKQEWTLFGIGLEALLNQFLEIDPDWVPPGSNAPSA